MSGEVIGNGFNGKVLPGGVDSQIIRPDGKCELSARYAIKLEDEARKNGHLIFLCTGCSKAELFPEILEVGFDGIIGAAGGYIEVGDEVLLHQRVKKEDVQHLVEFFNKHGIDLYLESNGGLFASENCKIHIHSIIRKIVIRKP